jgi:peptidoglycan/LPS O-acetylase OafA/YrhL
MSSAETSLAQRMDRNHVVDSFRGLACLAVVIIHINEQVKTARFPASIQFHDWFGSELFYLFQGSSVYFMVITGFMLGSQLPKWSKSRSGLFIKAMQRTSKIMIVYWAAIIVLILVNLIRKLVVGNVWVPATISDVFLQCFFLNDFRLTPLYVPPAWYLQADIIIFTLVVSSYLTWSRLSYTWQIRLRPAVFLCTIPLLGLALYIEAFGLATNLSLAVVRLMLYFNLGFLAYHAQQHKSALLSYIVLVIAMLICNDWTSMHQRFYTNTSIVLTFIFAMSRYSTAISALFNQPWMKKLYQLNFSIFLLHWFILILGISLARHLAPNSVVGLVLVIVFTLVLLFVLASLFERFIQRPLLRWHNQVWAYWLNETPREKLEPAQTAKVVMVQYPG